MTSWTEQGLARFEAGGYADRGVFSCATGQGAVKGLQSLPQPSYDRQDWSTFTTRLGYAYQDACVSGSRSYAADYQAARTAWTRFVNEVVARWPALGQRLETAPLDF
jgi:hypothetical protein